ncbi:MAG: FG-GAP-like repeat-containing protein [Myxococcota bacterium]|nr:FG-GAP-like repeat-containing protein [Myxococcota bacterium]
MLHSRFPQAALILLAGCSDYAFNPTTSTSQGDDTASPGSDSDIDTTPGECNLDTPQSIAVALSDVCDVPYQAGTFTPVVEWELPGNNAYGPPSVGHLDDDNLDGIIGEGDTPDIVYSTNSWSGLLAVDGKTGQIKWQNNQITDGTSGTAIGDLDGDGIPEIIAANGVSQIVALSNDGMMLWSTNINNSGLGWFLYPSIADLDGDGLAEVIAGRNILDFTGAVVGSGQYGVGACMNQGSSSIEEGSVAVAADLNGDGELEVVVGNAAYRRDGSALWYNGGSDGIPAVADMDLDGEPEIIVIGGNRVWTMEADGTATGWSDSFSNTNYLGPPAIDDLDGDGVPEFVIVGSGEMRAYEWDGSRLWTQTVDDSSGAAGPILFDFEGDGYPEVVYADESTVRVFNGLDGSIKLQSNNHSSATGFETPIVADVDADGQAEIIMLHGSGSFGLTVYGDLDQSWLPGRQVWNQHAYTITNVDDDGGIPLAQQANWEHYNNFRSGDGGLPPSEWDDLQPEIVEICVEECPEVMELSVRVWNRGTGSVAPGVTVVVRAGYGGPIVAAEVVTSAINTGMSSRGVILRVNMADLGGADPIVDLDSTSGPMQFMAECDEDNNDLFASKACD